MNVKTDNPVKELNAFDLAELKAELFICVNIHTLQNTIKIFGSLS